MRGIITILARAGSKGLPNKHLLSFNGKPLVEWTIEQAVRIADWERYAYSLGELDVVVSSDSHQILAIAEKYGAIPFQRSEELAKDDVGKIDSIREVLSWMENKYEKYYDFVIDLDATNPCRLLENIEESFLLFKKKRPKTLFSVTKSKKNAYFNQVFMEEKNNRFGAIFSNILRRQDTPDCCDINANIYIYDAEWLRNSENKFVVTDNSEVYIMPDWTYCDIDSELDFQVAEFLHRKYMLEYPRDDCEVNGRY